LRVLLIDDHVVVRKGLLSVLAALDTDITFLEAEGLDDALRFVSETPDLILLDLYMPGINGFSALTRIGEVFESAKVVVLSSEENPKVIRGAVANGAAGFIPKSSQQEVLVQALLLVLKGGTYLPPQVIGDIPDRAVEVLEQSAHPSPSPLDALSPRKRDVLRLLLDGKSNKLIARTLGISDHTVKAHIDSVYRALGVRSRYEAMIVVKRLEEKRNGRSS